MASKKKIEEIEAPIKEIKTVEDSEGVKEINEPSIPAPEEKVEPKKVKKGGKYPIGSIVFVGKEVNADLNGFKLFPQYKKYTYTVEAYEGDSEVYSLRRLNLLLKLKEADIVAPGEREDSSLVRKQF